MSDLATRSIELEFPSPDDRIHYPQSQKTTSAPANNCDLTPQLKAQQDEILGQCDSLEQASLPRGEACQRHDTLVHSKGSDAASFVRTTCFVERTESSTMSDIRQGLAS